MNKAIEVWRNMKMRCGIAFVFKQDSSTILISYFLLTRRNDSDDQNSIFILDIVFFHQFGDRISLYNCRNTGFSVSKS